MLLEREQVLMVAVVHDDYTSMNMIKMARWQERQGEEAGRGGR